MSVAWITKACPNSVLFRSHVAVYNERISVLLLHNIEYRRLVLPLLLFFTVADRFSARSRISGYHIAANDRANDKSVFTSRDILLCKKKKERESEGRKKKTDRAIRDREGLNNPAKRFSGFARSRRDFTSTLIYWSCARTARGYRWINISATAFPGGFPIS